MIDPLAEVVALLQPRAPFSKLVSGAGRWRVRRADHARPFFCVMLEGSCRLAVDGHAPITLAHGDFVLIPVAQQFTMSSLDAPPLEGREPAPSLRRDGEIRHGRAHGPPDVRLRVGYCDFACPDTALLASLLSRLVHVRGEPRLATLAQLVGEESRAQRPARDVVLAHLLEVLLIEALRATAGSAASPGLVRGLADARLAAALRMMHRDPERPWTVAQLAKAAALSRSAFFERFSRTLGMAPMTYLLTWRMALAKDLLRRHRSRVADVAQRIGYGSTSAFSIAFARHVGMSPSRYARAQTAPQKDRDAAVLPRKARRAARASSAA